MGTDLRFFDIEADPPKNRKPPFDGALKGEDGRVRRLLSYTEFLGHAYDAYLRRNQIGFRWVDGDEEPIDLADAEFPEMPEKES
jgi:hypothetical protein